MSEPFSVDGGAGGSMTIALTGATGSTTWCYWAISENILGILGATLASNSVCITNGPATLTPSDFITLTWTAPEGSIFSNIAVSNSQDPTTAQVIAQVDTPVPVDYGQTMTFTDDGSYTPYGSPPLQDFTGIALFAAHWAFGSAATGNYCAFAYQQDSQSYCFGSQQQNIIKEDGSNFWWFSANTGDPLLVDAGTHFLADVTVQGPASLAFASVGTTNSTVAPITWSNGVQQGYNQPLRSTEEAFCASGVDAGVCACDATGDCTMQLHFSGSNVVCNFSPEGSSTFTAAPQISGKSSSAVQITATAASFAGMDISCTGPQ